MKIKPLKWEKIESLVPTLWRAWTPFGYITVSHLPSIRNIVTRFNGEMLFVTRYEYFDDRRTHVLLEESKQKAQRTFHDMVKSIIDNSDGV